MFFVSPLLRLLWCRCLSLFLNFSGFSFPQCDSIKQQQQNGGTFPSLASGSAVLPAFVGFPWAQPG